MAHLRTTIILYSTEHVWRRLGGESGAVQGMGNKKEQGSLAWVQSTGPGIEPLSVSAFSLAYIRRRINSDRQPVD